jgi:hypothetical protein
MLSGHNGQARIDVNRVAIKPRLGVLNYYYPKEFILKYYNMA